MCYFLSEDSSIEREACDYFSKTLVGVYSSVVLIQYSRLFIVSKTIEGYLARFSILLSKALVDQCGKRKLASPSFR